MISKIPNPIMGTRIIYFRRKPPLRNLLLLKPPLIISLFSTFAAETPFNRKTFSHIFRRKANEAGSQAHARMIVSGFKPTVIVANCLLQMYTKCSPLECALKVFDKIPERACVSWNTMMFGYSVNGKMELARPLFDLMPQRDLISWSSLISGYLQNGNCLNAVELFVMMGRDSVAYNETTLSVVSKAIASLEDTVLGHQVHGVAVKIGFDCQVVTGTAILDMYGKCKMLDEARRIFDAFG